MPRRQLLIAALFACATGCADNAILTVELTLPAAAPDRNFAFVQARSGEAGRLAEDWNAGSSLDGFRLRMAEREVVRFDIAADGDLVDATLLMKVRFCASPACDTLADEAVCPSEQHYVFERAFYQGERTRYEHEITDLPAPCDTTMGCMHPRLPVDKCDVFGCIGGESTSGCTGDDGMGPEHYCEQ